MKVLMCSAMLVFWLAAVPVHAAEAQGAHGNDHERVGETTHAGRGKIVSIDMEAGTVKIAHGPIESLNWKSMTMDFTLREAAMLNEIKPGMTVNFELTKVAGGYRVEKVTPAP